MNQQTSQGRHQKTDKEDNKTTMNDITFNELSWKAEDHLVHIISSSKDKDELLFRLSGFYGGLIEVLKENKKSIRSNNRRKTYYI